MKRILIIAAFGEVSLAACGSRDESNGAVTPEEAAALNNAAEMLDASPDSLVAPNEAMLGNGEEAAVDAPAGNADGSAADNGAAVQ